ncbi:uncharacterized protein LOC115743330 isoform X2 [Rhodamnia argentea]|uniref:Uncharacterized protein LOC115743330 isoform X2 n=1 Tax=Rhodamnia argentea TaxID=178133 RepID=A0A8B8PIF7_9MYRT|nr:uncharacterized protein LOC115743330 isoform X2 [Rhodamnia argentea]
MDQSKSRKGRFAPKAPTPRKKPQTDSPKTEVNGEDGDEEAAAQAEAQMLLHRFHENFGRRGATVEKKSPVQVAFGPGAPSSASAIRTYGVPKEERSDQSSGSRLRSYAAAKGQTISPPIVAKTDAIDATMEDATAEVPRKIKKEYKELWDFQHSYYPTTLPLRMPYSGNPDILDEKEFGDATRNFEYDEGIVNAASELGLLEESGRGKMMFFQLPPNLPSVKRSTGVKRKEKAESSTSSVADASERGCSLEDLPGGYMGKLVVYKSGAVKLKLGEMLYDVSPGSDCIFAQDVAAINTADKHFCSLGELGKRAVITPDIDSLLNDIANADARR